MSDLMLMLKPNEEVMINGVVVRNGNQGTHLHAAPADTSFLRMSEAIAPLEATTPLKKALYIAQLGIGGALDSKEALRILESALSVLAERYSGGQEAVNLKRASMELSRGRLNGVLRQLSMMLQSDCGEREPSVQSAGQEAVKLYSAPHSIERSVMRRYA